MNQIDTFINGWKEAARAHYTAMHAERQAIRHSNPELTLEAIMALTKYGWGGGPEYTQERAERSLAEAIERPDGVRASNLKCSIKYQEECRWVKRVGKVTAAIVDDIKNLDKILEREAESRKKKFIATVEAKAGKIIDTQYLYIGVDGGINGAVIGETAKVNVTTIYAGGYNIQCLHYRTLVKVAKN
jgi:hypothetical protein